MNALLEAAAEVHACCQEKGWSYCIVGGMAVLRWGKPRTTQDVDLTLLTGFGEEERFVDALLERFQPRRADARSFALKYRILLLNSSKQVGIDVALGALPFEESTIARATPYQYAPGVTLITVSAEDLVVTKAFAGRPQDWGDLRGILQSQRGRLDWPYIEGQLGILCEMKESPETLDELLALRDRLAK